MSTFVRPPMVLLVVVLVALTVVMPVAAQEGNGHVEISLSNGPWAVAEFQRADADCNLFAVVAGGAGEGFSVPGRPQSNAVPSMMFIMYGQCNGQTYSQFGYLQIDPQEIQVSPNGREATANKVITYTEQSCGCPITIEIHLQWTGTRPEHTNVVEAWPTFDGRYFRHVNGTVSQAQVSGSITHNGVTLVDGQHAYLGWISDGRGQYVWVTQ
jgi:hypothetical protein